jgi:hypothetical protein
MYVYNSVPSRASFMEAAEQTPAEAGADWLVALSRLWLQSARGGATRLIVGGAPTVSCPKAWWPAGAESPRPEAYLTTDNQ